MVGRLGVTGKALDWVGSFLKGHTFQVFDKGCTSNILPVTCRIPQRSSLSPTLFNIYQQPLADLIASFGMSIATSVNDTQLVFLLTSGSDLP